MVGQLSRFSTKEGNWKLAQRLPLFSHKRGRPSWAEPPIVGPSMLAVAHHDDFCRILQRRTHAVVWKGRVPHMWPLAWHGDDHLILAGWGCVGAWSVEAGRVIWRVEEDELGGYSVWKNAVVLYPAGKAVELREIVSGTTFLRISVAPRKIREVWLVGDHVVHGVEQSPGTVCCVGLASGTQEWQVALDPLLEAAWRDRLDAKALLSAWLGSDRTRVIVQWGPLLAALRLSDGAVIWRRALECDLGSRMAVCTQGRLVSLRGGRFIMLDEGTGETLTDSPVGGFMEMGCEVVGDVVVTPSQMGLLATHSLTDGRLISLQEFKVAFGGAVYVDGLLYAGATDGALWLFEPNPTWDASRSPATVAAWAQLKVPLSTSAPTEKRPVRAGAKGSAGAGKAVGRGAKSKPRARTPGQGKTEREKAGTKKGRAPK